MKILHVSCNFFPRTVGGTEVYVYSLCRALMRRGHGNAVVFLDYFKEPTGEMIRQKEYEYDGISVFALERNETALRTEDLYLGRDEWIDKAFGDCLARVRPQVLHVHNVAVPQTSGMLSVARAQGIPVVFTYHTPAISCGRENLRLFGKGNCSGKVEERRCLACLQTAFGIPRIAAETWSMLPLRLAELLSRLVSSRGWKGPAATWLQLPWLSHKRCAHVGQVFSLADYYVAVCGWGRDLMRCNGVPEEKILLCRHGIDGTEGVRRKSGKRTGILRVGYIGRIDELKGVHVLLQSLRFIPKTVPLEVRVCGTIQGPRQQKYARHLKTRFGRDPRIIWEGEVPMSRRYEVISSFDVLSIPSIWMETGPLVLLEAWRCGVPVIGSRLGGIAEMLQEGRGGLLCAPGDPRELAEALQRLAGDPELLESLAKSIPPVRTMDDVGVEMESLYAQLVRGKASTL